MNLDTYAIMCDISVAKAIVEAKRPASFVLKANTCRSTVVTGPASKYSSVRSVVLMQQASIDWSNVKNSTLNVFFPE